MKAQGLVPGVKEEIFICSAYQDPPENDDIALQRIQIAFDNPNKIDILREATLSPPLDDVEAINRIRLAGSYPSNLIRTKWRSTEQFFRALNEVGWLDVKNKIFMNSGRYVMHLAIASQELENGRHQIAFCMLETPTAMEICCARGLQAGINGQKWLDKTMELMNQE